MKKLSKTKCMLLVVITLLVVVFVAIDATLPTTANVVDKLKFWEEIPLQNVGFSDLYPKPLYEKSYFGMMVGGLVSGLFVVVEILRNFFSNKNGAPRSAPFVSTFASWIGRKFGIRRGSYMAGLAILGGFVGGNAMVASAILNGLSYGLIGGGIGFSPAAVSRISFTFYELVDILESPGSGEPYYKFSKLILPNNLGSDKVIKLVKEIHEYEEKIDKARAENNFSTANRHQSKYYENLEIAESMLTKLLESNQKVTRSVQENLLVLSIVSHENNNFNLFQEGIKKFIRHSNDFLDDSGFLHFLEAMAYLYDQENNNARGALDRSIRQNPYAIEPIILYVDLMSDDLPKNEKRILEKIDFAEQNYDFDKYSSPYTLSTLFFRAGKLFLKHQRCVKAKQFFEKAENKIKFLERLFASDEFENYERKLHLEIANSYHCMGDKKKASKIFHRITKSLEGDKLNEIRQQFAGYNN